MSLQQLSVVTEVLPDSSQLNQDHAIIQLQGPWSYGITADNDFTTLSSNGIGLGDSIRGLLYVPDLPHNSSCINDTAPYIPNNVTRQSNLPSNSQQFVAIAPWLSPACTTVFLNQARTVQLVAAMLFYLPDTSTSAPPPANESIWSLNDGGAWKARTPFPVYAISSTLGRAVIVALAAYSGNMTNVPFSHNLTESFDPTDYVRLAAVLRTAPNQTNLPSLWVFLLVVLGILLAVIGLTSLTMHWIQRNRRATLRRRVANGEVDLEALGIKRLTIPQEILDTMPLYAYGTTLDTKFTSQVALLDSMNETSLKTVAENSSGVAGTTDHLFHTHKAPHLIRSTSYHPAPLSQPTCAICLDDFVAAGNQQHLQTTGTIVRELPCRHIFHPECVDTFLRDNSSLCPMCKKSALPKGYCPRIITNAMVRRERIIRQMRETVTGANHRDSHTSGIEGSIMHLRRWPLTFFSGRQSFRENDRPSSRDGSTWTTEMVRPAAPTLVRPERQIDHNAGTSSGPVFTQTPLTPGRREWARQRAIALLGGRMAPEDPEAEEYHSKPAWRRFLTKIFPVLGR